jgi:hypothetical protein
MTVSTIKKAKTPTQRVYALRTCNAALQSYNGFQWPASGKVSAPDWEKSTRCGQGLHGLLAGAGNAELLDWSPDAVWMIVDITEAYKAGDVIDLQGKVKFPACEIAHKGDQRSATQFLIDAGITGPIVGAFITAGVRGTATAGVRGTATAGDSGTATAGDSGTATAGDSGTATAGDSGTATAGYGGTATAGDSGTATAGDSGTATAGYGGTVQVKWWDGARYRVYTGYVGEDGIEANTAYRVEGKRLVKA